MFEISELPADDLLPECFYLIVKAMVDIRGYKFSEADINFRPKFIFLDPKIYVHVRQSLNYGQFGSGFAFI